MTTDNLDWSPDAILTVAHARFLMARGAWCERMLK